MREVLRGALLSVLFFGLMISGPPVLGGAQAWAEQWTPIEGPCQGGTGYILTQEAGCVTLEEFNHNNTCDNAGDNLAYAGIFGGAGLIGMVIPEPFTSAAGMGAMIWGGIHGIVGGLGWVINDC